MAYCNLHRIREGWYLGLTVFSQIFLVLSPCLRRLQEMLLMTSVSSWLLCTVQVYTLCTGLCASLGPLWVSRPRHGLSLGSELSPAPASSGSTVPGLTASRLQSPGTFYQRLEMWFCLKCETSWKSSWFWSGPAKWGRHFLKAPIRNRLVRSYIEVYL